MWILIRVLVAATAFVVRMVSRTWKPAPTGTLDGLPHYVSQYQDKSRPIGFKVGLPLRLPLVFKLSREVRTDSWYKRLGLVKEIQTRDARFDERVYVACDHPLFGEYLQQNEELRNLLRAALSAGVRTITSDGAVLWLHSDEARAANLSDSARLLEIHRGFRRLAKEIPGRLQDPFLPRALAIEAMLASIFAYAVVAALEYWTHEADVYVQTGPLVARGLLMGLAILVAVGGAIVLLLRGSSRAGRLMTSSLVVLVLSGPVAGIQLANDLNRGLDDGPPEMVECPVVRPEVVVKQRRRSGPSYSYYLNLGAPTGPTSIDINRRVRVDKGTFETVGGLKRARLILNPGWLGIPWYRGIEAGR